MKAVVQGIFNLAIVVAISVGLYVSRNWPDETALFPRAIGYPVLLLSLVTLRAELFNGWRGLSRLAKEGIPFGQRAFVVSVARIFGWLVGFAAAIWAFGFNMAVPVFVFGYMKLQGRLSWMVCMVSAAAATAFVWIVFGVVFQVNWPEGAVLEVLREYI